MKVLLLVACLFFASGVWAAECVTNARGKTVCSNGTKAAVVNPHTGTVTTAQKNPSGVTTAQTSNGQKAVAVNPNTGNVAVAQKNQNGVTTTQSSRGGTAKTKNGMGVAIGPNGTVCAKGKNNQGCKKP